MRARTFGPPRADGRGGAATRGRNRQPGQPVEPKRGRTEDERPDMWKKSREGS